VGHCNSLEARYCLWRVVEEANCAEYFRRGRFVPGNRAQISPEARYRMAGRGSASPEARYKRVRFPSEPGSLSFGVVDVFVAGIASDARKFMPTGSKTLHIAPVSAADASPSSPEARYRFPQGPVYSEVISPEAR